VDYKLHLFLAFFSLNIIISSCESDRFDIDISDMKLKMNFVNLDSMLKNASSNELIKIRSEFKKKKSDVLDYNFGYCLHINLNDDTAFFNGRNRFYSNEYMVDLENSILKENILNQARKRTILDGFKRLKSFFPLKKIPESIYQINSSFSSSVFSTDREIAIGIERYLGPENLLIKQLPSQEFYEWIKESMRTECLERDVLVAWLMTNYLEETTENYASEMIRWGKILFIARVCLPELEERIILRYNQQQFEWAQNSKKSIWRYFVENEVLFKIDEETRANLLKEGPYTIGLPEESPDRIGQFMGFEIVSNYMNEKEISLEKLITTPYNEILQKYKLD
jgi:hypothetical protein